MGGRDPMGKPIFGKFETFPSNGQGTCHVSLHAEYGLLHVSNYVGGSFTSLRVDKSSGEILGEVYNEYFGDGSHVDPDRQEASHAHGTFTVGPFIYVVDLGADKIWHFKASGEGKFLKPIRLSLPLPRDMVRGTWLSMR